MPDNRPLLPERIVELNCPHPFEVSYGRIVRRIVRHALGPNAAIEADQRTFDVTEASPGIAKNTQVTLAIDPIFTSHFTQKWDRKTRPQFSLQTHNAQGSGILCEGIIPDEDIFGTDEADEMRAKLVDPDFYRDDKTFKQFAEDTLGLEPEQLLQIIECLWLYTKLQGIEVTLIDMPT